MRALFLAILMATVYSSAASASSLAQCRAVLDRDARLNCYDSIAIGSASAPAVAASPFEGAYAGVSGHFGGANETLHHYDWLTSKDHAFRLNSPSLGVFAGYNQPIGNMIIGVEASLRGDVTKAIVPGNSRPSSFWSDYYTPELNQSISDLMQSGNSGQQRLHLSPWYVGKEYTDWWDIKELASPLLSVRAGVGIGNTLLYGRGGVGASYMASNSHLLANDQFCDEGYIDVTYQPGMASHTSPVCTSSRTENETSTTTKRHRLAPTFAAAIGAEYHHDRYFGRVEAEARYIYWGNRFLPSGESGTMRYQLGFGAGIKF